MGQLFFKTTFNGDISRWDVSNVREMSRMFSESYFNRDISKWNVGNVLNMQSMFEHSLFNKDISSWNVSSVQNMDYMFARSNFCKDISGWDVSGVNTHYQTFYMSILPDEFRPKFRVNEDYLDKQDVQLDSVSVLEDARVELDKWIQNGIHSDEHLAFNPCNLPDKFYPVNDRIVLRRIIDLCVRDYGEECNLNWVDVSRVRQMGQLFFKTTFNGDISRWDVSDVRTMLGMFANSEFNGNISEWDVSRVRNMSEMFSRAVDFDQDISGWNISEVDSFNNMFFDANSFRHDLSAWTIKQFAHTRHMFIGCPLYEMPDKLPRVEGTSSRVNAPQYKGVNEDYIERVDKEDIKKHDTLIQEEIDIAVEHAIRGKYDPVFDIDLQ
jgi:surface protein